MVKKRLQWAYSVAILMLLAGVLPAFGPSNTFAQTDTRTFAETGKTVKGRFLQYWNTNGGLAQQGFPITDELQEKSDIDGKVYTMQYFERAVFEMHPENKAPYDVLLSLLGRLEYEKRYAKAGAPGQKVNTTASQKFDATGKTVGGKFLEYWKAHGGLAQQGYPISEEFQEVSALDNKTYTVQYFERAVFELHPENKAPYDVLLSQLGTFQDQRKHGVAGPTLNKSVTGTIEMWHFWSSPLRRNAIRRVIGLCTAQLPGIKVNDVAKPFGDIWTANLTAVAAGSGMPDVIISDRPKLAQDAANEVYTDLQDRANRDKVNPAAFWPFTWQQTLYKGHTYGIPFETDVRVLFYNKNAFKEAGLDPNKPPKTWAEVQAYADKLDKKNADGTYARIGFSPFVGNVGFDVWGYTNSAEWVTQNQQIKVNDPKTVETLAWMKTWSDRYGGWDNLSKFRASFQSAPNDAFMSGKVAMVVDVNGYAAQLNFYNPQVPTAADPTKKERLDWAVSDIPYNTQQASWSGGFAMSIPKGAKNADAAWEFIKCATGETGAASWSRDTYAMSANLKAARDPSLLGDPVWQFFLDAMNYSTGGVFLEKYPNWGEQVNQRLEKVWKGELSPQQALQDAQAAIEAEVKK